MAILTLENACHLARRAGFSASDAQFRLLTSANSQEAAIDLLLGQSASIVELPSWYDSAPNNREDDPELRKILQRESLNMEKELKYWWFKQMVANTSPLQEKATLFWANHFTSSLKKVKWAPALLQQNLSLRTHAIGSFRGMLEAILQDPAMLIYLDNTNSKKQSPNENLARELLELFTMGEGNYTEEDIKELARALTGASIEQRTGLYKFQHRNHDNGVKTIFGETANFTPDDVADLILRQPQTGLFITDKLWRFFVNDVPDTETIAAISNRFVENDYDISMLLRELFLQEAFWAAQGEQIKSPMELVVGSMQLLDIDMLSQRQVLAFSKSMGQDLFDPPHVKGWASGKAWYTTGNLAIREQATQYFALHAKLTPDIAQLLATDAVATLPAAEQPHYLRSILSDPSFQIA